MHSSVDLVTWESVSVPSDANVCTALVSSGERLYAAWTTLAPGDSGRPVLHMLDGDSWKRLRNGVCPRKQLDPAAFNSDGSLVFVGGWDGVSSFDIVLEYSLKRQEWSEKTPWPTLPQPVHGLTAVQRGDEVHLAGGGSRTTQSTPNSTIFTLIRRSSRPIREWVTTAVQPSPSSACAACGALGHLVVAGGFHSGKVQKRVFVFDRESNAWLTLPHLALARYYCAMEFFRNSLIVFGGRTSEGLTGRAEILRNILPEADN